MMLEIDLEILLYRVSIMQDVVKPEWYRNLLKLARDFEIEPLPPVPQEYL